MTQIEAAIAEVGKVLEWDEEGNWQINAECE